VRIGSLLEPDTTTSAYYVKGITPNKVKNKTGTLMPTLVGKSESCDGYEAAGRPLAAAIERLGRG